MSRRRSLWWRLALLVVLGLLPLAGCSPPGAPARPPPIRVTPAGPGAPPRPAAPAAARTSFTVVASGDVLIHPPLVEQARADGGGRLDFAPMLAGIRPVISAADLAICHLETPLAPPEGPYAGYPSFDVPPQIATALVETGYDTCSTASNHTLDQGRAGVARTLDTLDAAGLHHTGSARSAAEAARPLLLDVAGVAVAQLSFAYGFNGIRRPAATPWLVNQTSAPDVLAAARAARVAGAQVVIVSLHWGREYQAEPTAQQRALAAALLADPSIDLIIGHHVHVVQPFERIDGKWVAYGLGNLVARHDPPDGATQEGVIARFTFSRDGSGHWSVSRAEYLPTLVDLGPPIRVLDLTTAPPTPRALEALRRTAATVDALGADTAGLARPAR